MGESWKLNNPDNFQRETTPIRKPTSPTLLTIIALIAALLACILVYQKLISKYEVNPTPSQPINICTTLSAVTKNIIKKVNRDKYPINLLIWASLHVLCVVNSA